MDENDTKTKAKLVEALIDALGYSDPETYELISQIVYSKLKELLKIKPKKFAYLEAYLPQPDRTADEFDAWYNSKMLQSSEVGVPEAQYQRACQLWENSNYESAVNLYKASADQGHPKSQYCYGLGLRDGVGIPQDKNKGLLYIELAAGRLYSYALEYLIGLYHDDLSVQGSEKVKLYSNMLKWSESEN